MLGDIVVRLYDETPIHRDNFVKLVKEGYYDGTLFHRVIKDFMIQGGDPDSKGAPAGKMLGVGGPDYTLEAEIKPDLFHKRGALAAAHRDEIMQMRRDRNRAGLQELQDRIIAMQQMHIGDKWELYIPAEMGYGKFSQPGIPAGSTLIFEIELIAIA